MFFSLEDLYYFPKKSNNNFNKGPQWYAKYFINLYKINMI